MKKRIFVRILALILTAFLTAPMVSYAQGGEYETIKVGLFYGSTQKQAVTLACPAGFTIGFLEDGVFSEVSGLIETEIRVVANPDGTVVIDGIFANDTGRPLAVYPAAGNLTVDGTEYRGAIEFLWKNGALTVINNVNLDQYLYSVLGAEMSPSWHIEALKAQAICARTYAANNWNKHASDGFSLCTTTHCQVYNGVKGEADSTRRASDETSGQMVKYEGENAQVFFFASSGGTTANVKYVWGSEYPYLSGVDDPYEDPATASYATWTETLTAEETRQKLAASGVDIGAVKDVAVTGIDGETVYEVTITGETGTHVLKNEKVRTFFGLRSQNYKLVPQIGGSVVANWDLVRRMAMGESISSLFGTGTYVFSGKGWGHRVGMSQCGAKGMAEHGFNAQQILEHYFPGAYVE